MNAKTKMKRLLEFILKKGPKIAQLMFIWPQCGSLRVNNSYVNCSIYMLLSILSRLFLFYVSKMSLLVSIKKFAGKAFRIQDNHSVIKRELAQSNQLQNLLGCSQAVKRHNWEKL